MEKTITRQEPAPATPTAQKVQKLRFYSQLFSAGINIWIGLQFYLFVKYVESGGQGTPISRPPGVESWLPIGSLVSLRHFFETGIVNTIHPAGMIIFVTIMLTALLFKKGFCSWVCPIGFISEMLGDLSDKLWRRRIIPPKWLDYPLRSLKYIIAGFFLWAICWSMTPEAIENFIYTEYNKISDILMLRFFTDITRFSLIVVVVLFALSLVIRGFWCRYLCPYGAILGILGMLSPTQIRRNKQTCIDCSSCTRVCPSFIDVDKIDVVRSDECTGCLACVDSCPVSNGLQVQVVKKNFPIPSLKWAAALLVVFWGVLLVFQLFGPWQNSVALEEYIRYIPSVINGTYIHP